MALVFDSLGYSRKLREGGIAQEQAEAMADAAREHIMLELVSKQDLLQEMGTLRSELRTEMASLEQRLSSEIGRLRQEMGELGLRLTVRLGVMLAAGITILGVLVRLA